MEDIKRLKLIRAYLISKAEVFDHDMRMCQQEDPEKYWKLSGAIERLSYQIKNIDLRISVAESEARSKSERRRKELPAELSLDEAFGKPKGPVKLVPK